ncbi:hypothetical protein O181_123495 [Austropuccinia psidii MF-1]|uniref:Reverse transcriptase Ty1/copia-type domain-containing protein n=1 Tax=Austropuccinia psidii MF-1 TaxID=1389203 RepID=A0A9Q3KR98_9BASI|nr:hypothetical protein [Austropuccinia psidii MF-1]
MCKLDPCVFYRIGKHPLWIYIHFNNIALFGNKVDQFKKYISSEFEIKDIGQADLLLGIMISHVDDGIGLNQQHFVESVLNLYGMSDCKQVSTPLNPQDHLEPATDKEIQEFNKIKIKYRIAIGSINFLRTATRLDLFFSVSTSSQYLEMPRYQPLEGIQPCTKIPTRSTKNWSTLHQKQQKRSQSIQ